MSRRVALLLGVVLVSTLAVAPGSAAAEYTAPDNVCDDDVQRLVVLLENGDVIDDEVSLFVDTTARIVLCTTDSDGSSPETTDAWGLSDIEGIETTQNSDFWIQIRTTGSLDPTDLSSHLEGRSSSETRAPTLAVMETGGTSTGYLNQPQTVQFHDSTTRDQFIQARNRYADADTETRTLARTLAEGAQAEDPIAAVDRTTLETVEDRRERLRKSSDGVEQALLRGAVKEQDNATAAYIAHREQRRGTEAEFEESLNAYLAAVNNAAGSARLVVTGALLVPFVLGAVGGGLVGRTVSLRDLKKTRRKRRRDSTVDYSLTNLWKVFVVALLAAGGSIAVLAVGAGIDVIFEVIA